MKTSKIITAENNIIAPKTQKRKIMESSAILVGTTAIVPAGFLLVDNFSNNKKDYIKSINNEKDVFEKTVQKNTNIGVGILKKLNKPIDDKVVQTIRENVEIVEKSKYEEKINSLNKIRKAYIKKGLTISAGIGISLGVAALAIKNTYEKQKSQSAQVNPTAQIFTNKTILNNNLYFGNKKAQVSFTGIVDKIANELTPQQLKKWQDYVNGVLPTVEETKWARRIADLRLKDWSKGILDNCIAKYYKPFSDKEYHTYLLKQEIIVPSQPPMYYRNYDKWFNTQRWQDFKK